VCGTSYLGSANARRPSLLRRLLSKNTTTANEASVVAPSTVPTEAPTIALLSFGHAKTGGDDVVEVYIGEDIVPVEGKVLVEAVGDKYATAVPKLGENRLEALPQHSEAVNSGPLVQHHPPPFGHGCSAYNPPHASEVVVSCFFYPFVAEAGRLYSLVQ
jgi:hypothetical protein